MKLALGTVQFGLNYGISNSDGQTAFDEVARILGVAAAGGVAVLDTAAAYGQSEEVLGRALSARTDFRLVTKLPSVGGSHIGAKQLATAQSNFEQSLVRLGRSAVYGLLLHRADDLLLEGGEELYHLLLGLKQAGLVKKIGVSAYAPEQIDGLLDRFPLDLVQVPLNVFDQRHLSRLPVWKSRGMEIHTRSAFLQGLLLMELEAVPTWLTAAITPLRKYRRSIAEWNQTPLQAALAFVKGVETVDQVVVGVTSVEQLKEVLSAYHSAGDGPDFRAHSLDDLNILDPSRWKQL